MCGMNIDSESAAGRTELNGQTYYFCSAKWKEKFESAPGAVRRPDGWNAEARRRLLRLASGWALPRGRANNACFLRV